MTIHTSVVLLAQCDIVKYIFGLCSLSWYTLGISKVSLYATELTNDWMEISGWGLVTGKTRAWLESWDFQPHPFWHLGDGRGTEGWVDHQWFHLSCLGNEVPIKISERLGLWSFWIAECLPATGGWYTPALLERKCRCSGPFQTSPYVDLHLAAPLYPSKYPF